MYYSQAILKCYDACIYSIHVFMLIGIHDFFFFLVTIHFSYLILYFPMSYSSSGTSSSHNNGMEGEVIGS